MEERYNDDLLSLNDLQSQHTPPNPEKGCVRKTKTRKGNFSPEDDSLLLSAWLNTSFDSISEVEKSKSSFWDRIHEYYDKHKKSTISERSSCSLRNRWSIIQIATLKFCGALAEIERRSPSGVPEQDKVHRQYHFISLFIILYHTFHILFTDLFFRLSKRKSFIGVNILQRSTFFIVGLSYDTIQNGNNFWLKVVL